MIWAFEYLNEKQIEELNYLNPMMDFQYDFVKQMYYWKWSIIAGLGVSAIVAAVLYLLNRLGF